MEKVPEKTASDKEQEMPNQGKKPKIPTIEADISETVIDDGYLDILEDKKVAVFFVGMKTYLEKNFGTKSINAEQLIKAIPQISNYCEVEVHESPIVHSASMTPELMLELSKQIQDTLKKPDICSAVVVHGIDVLEETAYFIGISLSENFQTQFFKPIIFTTASSQDLTLSNDLPLNLLSSIRVACHDFKEWTPQVLVCVNNEIHGAKNVRRVKTFGADSFKSPSWGPVGHVYPDSVSMRSGSMNEDTGLNFPTPMRLTAHVGLIKAMTGDTGEVVDLMRSERFDAIVVEGFGGGNLPVTMMASILKAIDEGILVAIATRCQEGRVIDEGDFIGSASDLIQAGALTAGETSPAKARLLLLYILSQPEALKLREQNPQLFKAFLQECLDPVLAERLFAP